MFSLKGILGENIATLLHLKSCLRMLEVAIINLNFLWVQGSKKNMYSKKIEIKHSNQIPCQHGQPTVPTIVKPETNKTVQRIKLPKMYWYAFFEGLFIKHAAQILTHKKIFAKLTTIHVPCQPFLFLFKPQPLIASFWYFCLFFQQLHCTVIHRPGSHRRNGVGVTRIPLRQGRESQAKCQASAQGAQGRPPQRPSGTRPSAGGWGVFRSDPAG